MNHAEAAILVSFRVLANGQTDDVAVVMSVGHPDFRQPAIDAVSRWKYAPTTKDGVPVDSARIRVVIPFQMTADSIGGARDASKKELVAAREALAVRDLERARAHVEALDAMEWLTLYEITHRSLVDGILALHEGRYDEAAVRLGEATLLDDRFIGDWGYRDALGWRARAVHFQERYGFALYLIRKLDALGSDPPPEDLVRIASKLEAIRDRGGELVRHETVALASPNDRDPREVYVPLRRRLIVMSDPADALRRIGLRCDAHEEELEPDADETITLPEDWGDCQVDLHGPAGTRLTIRAAVGLKGSRAILRALHAGLRIRLFPADARSTSDGG
jgi:TonB family protein